MTAREAIEKALQELINARHLYQSVEVDFRPVVRDAAREMHARMQRDPGPGSFTLEDAGSELSAEYDRKEWVFSNESPSRICFSVPPVKTLCSVCDGVESFNLWTGNLLGLSATPQIPSIGMVSHGIPGEQIFVFPLECQGCRSNLIVFMVNRKERKIQLVGRSEFERVKAPDYINKQESEFYSDAVIAFNCGQFLPALFMLRTLIEQHMRRVPECTDTRIRGDDLCDKYNAKLNKDFADFVARFPSFKSIYSKLSAALHSADADKELFESQLKETCLHIEGLELFSRTKSPTTEKKR